MAYYLSYILNSDEQFYRNALGIKLPAGLYHSSLALIEHTPPELPKTVVKLGFFNSSQVEMEDFLLPKKGRKFYHKTYPITSDEMVQFLKKINEDRQLGIYKIAGPLLGETNNPPALDLGNRNPEQALKKQRKEIHLGEEGNTVEVQVPYLQESVPGGPQYSFYRFNCKSYALSVLKAVGIRDRDLKDWIVDDPGSGKLEPLELEASEDNEGILICKTPLKVSARLSSKKMNALSSDERAEIEQTLNYNELHGMIQDATQILEAFHPELGQPGKALYEDLLAINEEIKSLSMDIRVAKDEAKRFAEVPAETLKEHLEQHGDPSLQNAIAKKLEQNPHQTIFKAYHQVIQEKTNQIVRQSYANFFQRARQSIQKFEASIDPRYTVLKYIADTLKSALNRLGADFKLSSTYKSKEMLSFFRHKEAKKLDPLSSEKHKKPRIQR